MSKFSDTPEQRVAIVTGAGRGLGYAYAAELAAAGTAVIVNDADPQAAESAAAELRAVGGRAIAVAAPVGPASTARLLVDAAVDEFGRLDALVANAGVLRDAVLWKTSDEDFDTVIDVHLRGTFTTVREAAIRFRAQGTGGRIVAVGSTTGQRGNFGQGGYAAAKAAIVGAVRSWALELARYDITVNAVIPTAATAMTSTVPFFAEYVAAAEENRPLPPYARRVLGIGTPADVAGLVGFLASAESAGITGQALGAGGDRLSVWSHPDEVVVAFRDGGWDRAAVAEGWQGLLASHAQQLGPRLPAELGAAAGAAALPAEGAAAAR